MTAQPLFMSWGPITKTNNAGSIRLSSLSINRNALIKREGFQLSQCLACFNHTQRVLTKNMLQRCLQNSSGSLLHWVMVCCLHMQLFENFFFFKEKAKVNDYMRSHDILIMKLVKKIVIILFPFRR